MLNAEPVMISRWSGLGDVCMALCAAHAYKAVTGAEVFFRTAPQFRPLARACPHLAGVIEDRPSPAFREVPLHDARHGLSAVHEVDSFCEELGLVGVEPFCKTLDLDPGPEARRRVDELLGPDASRWVVLHPGSVDPNRTWPEDCWINLVNDLTLFGYPVVLIGATDGCFKVADKIAPPPSGVRVVDLTGQLTILETVALLQRAAALVSTDGGPIQLAGASRAAIVGLYSVVSGATRMPYRVGGLGSRAVIPSCNRFPCYRDTHDPVVWAAQNNLLAEAGVIGLGHILGSWCPGSTPTTKEPRYHCLKQEITPARVFRAVMEVL